MREVGRTAPGFPGWKTVAAHRFSTNRRAGGRDAAHGTEARQMAAGGTAPAKVESLDGGHTQ